MFCFKTICAGEIKENYKSSQHYIKKTGYLQGNINNSEIK